MTARGRVFVGISGGVDSAVAALRLQQAGYDVVGVFIRVWQPDFIDCNWEAERLDAMRVAAHLQIPFLMCDAQEAYKQKVADYFIAEYAAGRTPNPDVLCNKAVKFGVFYDFAMKHGADYIATGHYAQVSNVESPKLLRGVDTEKDQSYFLWMIPPEHLRHVLLPVGNSPKEQIRREALTAGIPVATKKDSQGICFLGHIDIPEFLSHFIDVQVGEVLNETGDVIGEHKGVQVYTIGQRHGFTINVHSDTQAPYYVIERNLITNTITVSHTKPTKPESGELTLTSLNLFTDMLTVGTTVLFQTRYRQRPLKATISSMTHKALTIQINEAHDIPSAGQSCVLYADDVCLGGGIIA